MTTYIHTYLYDEQGLPNPCEITEDEIIDQYWKYWYIEMKKKYGDDETLITRQNCIDDWVMVNWAWEK